MTHAILTGLAIGIAACLVVVCLYLWYGWVCHEAYTSSIDWQD